MKCISVRQPFAWAIIRGLKSVENRSKPSRHLGPLLIHAGKSRAALEALPDGTIPPFDELEYGAIIGMAEMLGCVTFTSDGILAMNPFASGPYCYILGTPVAFPPIPLKGQLGIFDVDDAILK